jgi:hypothetical protein
LGWTAGDAGREILVDLFTFDFNMVFLSNSGLPVHGGALVVRCAVVDSYSPTVWLPSRRG